MHVENAHAGRDFTINYHEGSNHRCCSLLEASPERGNFELFTDVRSLYETCRSLCEISCTKRNFWGVFIVGSSFSCIIWLLLMNHIKTVDLPSLVRWGLPVLVSLWLVSLLTCMGAALDRQRALTVGLELLNWAKTTKPPTSKNAEPPEGVLRIKTSQVERLQPTFIIGERFIRSMYITMRSKR